MSDSLTNRKDRNIFEWKRYLQILDMIADDRSQPYIAKKLGFKSASSVANILNRFQGLEALISDTVAKAEVHHLSNLSRAVGILEGLEHPDTYLIQQREKLLAQLKPQQESEDL